MEMQNWLRQIEKRGGMKNVVQFIFDSGKFHYIKYGIPWEEQVAWDEDDDVWIFYKKQQPFTINNRYTPQYSVEENENLQSIVFVEKEEDKRYYRTDV